MKVRKFSWLVLVIAVVGMSLAVSGCGKKPASADIDTGAGSGSGDDGSGAGSGSGSDRAGAGESDGMRIEDVYFDYDKYELRGEARSTLQSNARHLKENTGLAVLLEGHCDERGTNEYNLALGQRRADAVRSYLIDLGVDGSRLSTISYGEERPFALGHDESAWSQNRRVHFNSSGK